MLCFEYSSSQLRNDSIGHRRSGGAINPWKSEMHGLQLDRFSDREIIHELEVLVRRERHLTLGVVLHLGEVEARKLHVSLGYGSLFDYATKRLRYSESAACRRIRVARCLQKHPGALRLLRRNEINLSTLGLVCRILTDENAGRVLSEIRKKSQREVEAVVARYAPERVIHDRVRPVSVTVSDDSTGHRRSGGTPCDLFGDRVASEKQTRERPGQLAGSKPGHETPAFATHENQGHGNPRESPNPNQLDDAGHETGSQDLNSRFAFRFAAGPDFMAKFEEARALLSNRPGERLSFEKIFEAGLDAFLDRKSPIRRRARREKRRERQEQGRAAKRVGGAEPTERTDRPESVEYTQYAGPDERTGVAGTAQRTEPAGRGVQGHEPVEKTENSSRHVPVDVRDEVYARDEGRCTYVGPNGWRCGARYRVQVDHIEPFGLQGPSTETNLRLLCSEHNLLEAERVYGRDRIRRFRRDLRARPQEAVRRVPSDSLRTEV